jgi:hypothetical protein
MSLTALMLSLAACLAAQDAGQPCPQPVQSAALADGAEWRAKVTDADRNRLRNWRSAWVRAIDEARAGGHLADVAKEGALLEPDTALAYQDIPTGDYRCRALKLGTGGRGGLAYVAYPYFTCRIAADDGQRLRFTKMDGSQRPVGTLYPDGEGRRVFLGTLQLGDEQRSFRYGYDRDRDMAGVLQRIGERRWRLVLPEPAFESTLDVIELVPEGSE